MADDIMLARLKAILANCSAIESTTKVVMFGSRARGDFSQGSDVDIMLVYPGDVPVARKMSISKEIRTILAKMGIDADVIVKSQAEVERFKDKIGHVVRAAMAEGIFL